MLLYLHNKYKNNKNRKKNQTPPKRKMSITDLENDLKIPSPSQSDSDFGQSVSTKFMGAQQSQETINLLTKYNTHILEYIKFCMTKYHHELFLVICEHRAQYIKRYSQEQHHINKLKKTHQQSSSYLKNHLRQRKLNALYESGQDYDESYFINEQDDEMSELDYNLSKDADDTANLSEALRVISKGIDEITKLIKEKESIKEKKHNQNIFNIFTLIVTLYIVFKVIFAIFQF